MKPSPVRANRRQRFAPPHEITGEVVRRFVAHDAPYGMQQGPFDLDACYDGDLAPSCAQ